VLEIARCDQRPQEYNDPQDEVANTAAFLASEHAGAITGAVANLTGGMSID
jgi:enoyl-[acyl-carrier-protein] reductase (NADH)